MKRDFPFGWALLFALIGHAILGIVLKQNPLLIAAPAPSSNVATPMKMHFVESPPNAKTASVVPPTQNFSDANRKAGPLAPTEKRERKSTQYAQPSLPGKTGLQNRPPAAPARIQNQPTPLPKIEQPTLENRKEQGDYRLPVPGSDPKKLTDSLKNLDQFIGKGENSGSSGSSEGDLPSGDPGSGVFFDTQGFDLGPWANRVVAIVRSNWIVPVAAELGVKGVVGVAFQVERSGRIVNIQVVSESGTPSFDQAAVNALKSSNPFPPLPPDFPRNVLPGVFRFYYNVPVPGK